MLTTDMLWGEVPTPPYALAYSFYTKGFRSLYRTIRKRAALYDASYLHLIVVSAPGVEPLTALCELILKITTPSSYDTFQYSDLSSSHAAYACAYDWSTLEPEHSTSTELEVRKEGGDSGRGGEGGGGVRSLYPYGAIGPVLFMWSPPRSRSTSSLSPEQQREEKEHSLWLLTHPTISHFLAERLRLLAACKSTTTTTTTEG
jgi:hypothetical protein